MRERLRRNISSKLVGEVASRLISFAFNLVLARGLGAEGFGRYAYAYAFAATLALCGELGLNTLLTQEAARNREKAADYIRRFAPLRLASVAIVAATTVGLAFGAADPSRLLEIALLAVFMGANTLLDYHTAIFNAHERMVQEAKMRVATRIGVSLAGIAAVALKAPLLGVIAAVSIANLLAVLAGAAYRRRLGLYFGARWEPRFVGRALATAVPVATASLAINLYFYVDNLLLEALGFADAAIGEYGAALKILEAAQGLPLVVVGGTFPVVAQLARSGTSQSLAPFFSRVSRLAMLVVLPASGVGAILSPPVARLLFGPGFEAAGFSLALLALATPFYFSNLVAIYLLIAAGRRWQASLSRLGALALKVALVVALTPSLGVAGAAAAMIATDGLLFFALFAGRCRAGLAEKGEGALLLKSGLAAAAALGVWAAVRGAGVAVEVLAVAAAFAVAFALLRPDRWPASAEPRVSHDGGPA